MWGCVRQIEFCLMSSTDVWTPLSYRQSRNQCKQILLCHSLFLENSCVSQILTYYRGLSEWICFVLACNCSQGKKSSDGTLNPTRLQVPILQQALRLHMVQFPGNFFIQHFRKHLERYHHPKTQPSTFPQVATTSSGLLLTCPGASPDVLLCMGTRDTHPCDVEEKHSSDKYRTAPPALAFPQHKAGMTKRKQNKFAPSHPQTLNYLVPVKCKRGRSSL